MTHTTQKSGFALIATLSIMLLIVLLLVAMLTLSTTTTRSQADGKAQAEAQANARLALKLAIGDLQKQMGPDQRISANGAIVSETDVRHPHWTGVWDSWVTDPSSAPVNSNYPGAASAHQTIGSQPDNAMRPEYDQKDKYFRAWLLSLNEDDLNLDQAMSVKLPMDLALDGKIIPSMADTAIRLLGEGSLGSNANSENYVSARLISVADPVDSTKTVGRYGWWVGDESQKANIMDDPYQNSRANSLAERLNRQQAPASMGNSEISGLENVADQSSFEFIPTRGSLPLINGVTDQVTEQFHDITTKSRGILVDVREGGLKRDLSTILERAIDPEDVYNLTNVADFKRASSLKSGGDDFMLYRFDDMVNSISSTGEANVPIQDLAAYYQLYDRYRSGSMGGIQYTSRESSPPNNMLNNGIMVSNTDYGDTQTDLDDYLRQYTALYRNPALVKIEIILSYVTEPIFPVPTDPNADKYRLRIGVTPAMTFWNPNNVPVVMNFGDPDVASLMARETPIPLKITFKKSDSYSGPPTYTQDIQFNKVTNTQQGELYTLFVSGNYSTVFEPGESKVFALRFASGTDSNSASNYVDFMLRGRGNNRYSEVFVDELEMVPGWNPEKFIRPKSDTGGAGRGDHTVFTFNEDDFISASIDQGNYNTFSADFTQKSRHGRNSPGVKWHFRSFGIRGRSNADAAYRSNFVFQGFPLNGVKQISDTTVRTIELPAKSAGELIDAMGSKFNPRDDLPQPFFYYGIKAATETHESQNFGGADDGAGRRFPARPFTHSTPMVPAFLDNTDPASLYNYGWNWFFLPLDNLLDAPVEISGSNSGYYGGGYTAENGVTNIVQQQLPVTPPLSIATLSHAHLGGFSLATEAPAAGYTGLKNPVGTEAFRRLTAIGFNGLAPHTLQAIGNSYAHPNIPADKAYFTWLRQFAGSATTEQPFADHSYLANKALWDEFFFSSISPKVTDAKVFSGGKTVKAVAEDFFFNEQALPNPRIVPFLTGFDNNQLDELFTSYDQHKDGFADKIAAHLMVEGPFNINSTSVAAWKALFSSLKEHDVTYLDAKSALVVGTNLDFQKVDGVPIPGGPLPNGKSYQGSSTDPSDSEQWTGFRELTDGEIEELATAMVKQVKLRGPFLSLSDFINRRLDGSSSAKELALKGALQAAIDDPDCSINAGFRSDLRKFTNREESFVNAQFPEAMEGPIAYGSAAYVDQADILRSFPAQLTPRGDTFVIRAYGDSLDDAGNVVGRAWCEAVVQRLPEYLDPTDDSEVSQADLNSLSNQNFGRRLAIVKFRWLNPSEI